EASLSRFAEIYHQRYLAMMTERLGWGSVGGSGGDVAGRSSAEDVAVVESLFGVLTSAEIDQVIFFRELAKVPVEAGASEVDLLDPLHQAWYDPTAITGDVRSGLVDWLRAWGSRARLGAL